MNAILTRSFVYKLKATIRGRADAYAIPIITGSSEMKTALIEHVRRFRARNGVRQSRAVVAGRKPKGKSGRPWSGSRQIRAPPDPASRQRARSWIGSQTDQTALQFPSTRRWRKERWVALAPFLRGRLLISRRAASAKRGATRATIPGVQRPSTRWTCATNVLRNTTPHRTSSPRTSGPRASRPCASPSPQRFAWPAADSQSLFRVCPRRVLTRVRTARLLNDTIKETHVPHLAGVVFEGESVSPPSQIPWYHSVLCHPFAP